MISSTPGSRLRKGRKLLGKTQQTIAKEINKSLSAYRSWERDEAAPRGFRDIIAVCRACGISVQEYIEGNERRRCYTQEDIDLLELIRSFDHQIQKDLTNLLKRLAG